MRFYILCYYAFYVQVTMLLWLTTSSTVHNTVIVIFLAKVFSDEFQIIQSKLTNPILCIWSVPFKPIWFVCLQYLQLDRPNQF